MKFCYKTLLSIFFTLQLSLVAFSSDPFTPIDSVDSDVVVVGGGSAGVPAAVQAARATCKTILIESGFQLGGNATTGGVHFPGIFNAWGKQVIAGVGWEWIVETSKLGGCVLPDFSIPAGEHHWIHQINVNPSIYALVAEDLCINSGVELRYFEAPFNLEPLSSDSELSKAHNDAHWRVLTVSQGDLREIYCKELVDCTGNGRLCSMAGAELMREDETQPGSFFYYVNTHIDMSKLDVAMVEQKFKEAVESGELQESDAFRGIIAYLKNDAFNYVYSADSTTGRTRTETNIRGHQSALRMLRFVRSLPGGENATITSMSPEVGVRETYRVKCLYTITVDDYRSGKVWDDSLSYAYYPVDMHQNQDGVHPKQLEEGIVPTIPMRALIPEGVDHIVVAGRCLGSDRLANSGLRVQGACMSSGQDAGAIAVVAARTGKTPANIDVDEVKEVLRQGNAIVPMKNE